MSQIERALVLSWFEKRLHINMSLAARYELREYLWTVYKLKLTLLRAYR